MRVLLNRWRRWLWRQLFYRMIFGERGSQGQALRHTRIAPSTCIEGEAGLELVDHVFIGQFNFLEASAGLRLGEGLALTVADVDAERMRVHVRDAKGNRDRLVPLPSATLAVLRRWWRVHQHPRLLFPNRAAGRDGAAAATSALDRGGVQRALREVASGCGLKKRSPRIRFATAMPPT